MTLLIVSQVRRIVSFVQVLQYGREDFWVFVGKFDAFVCSFEELCSTGLCKVRRFTEDVFVGCEETLCWTNHYRNDGGVEWALDV